jgi:uncharacterized membrane protein YphA (DoxX/SURF4 family)
MASKEKVYAYFIVLMRILLGVVFLFSGYIKAQDIDGFIAVIYKIQFIPYIIANSLGIAIIVIELLIGIFLILGLYFTFTLRITFLILIIFTLFLSIVVIFKLEIDGCGCFGYLSKKNISILDIFKNILLLFIIILVFKNYKYGMFLSVDKKLNLPS